MFSALDILVIIKKYIKIKFESESEQIWDISNSRTVKIHLRDTIVKCCHYHLQIIFVAILIDVQNCCPIIIRHYLTT